MLPVVRYEVISIYLKRESFYTRLTHLSPPIPYAHLSGHLCLQGQTRLARVKDDKRQGTEHN